MMCNNNDLFSSLISDIKSYTGKDPILPWLRGIRKMKETLSPQVLEEKLPRFLQKCAQAFETDSRYTDDLRYLRVWLQLMDFVDDPKALLSSMEASQIGMKRSLFYQAYALYYEKVKKFEKADMMYHLGVKNLAEPLDELKRSYEQFLQRMERSKKKKMQRQQRMTSKGLLHVESVPTKCVDGKRMNQEMLVEKTVRKGILVKGSNPTTSNSSTKKIAEGDIDCGNSLNQLRSSKAESDECNKFRGEDTVVVRRFVDTAIVGKSRAEDACHHGLVEPTINTKEALNAINSMFREPLDRTLTHRRSNKSQPKAKMDQRVDNGFEVFNDDNTSRIESSNQNGEKGIEPPFQEHFQIYVDEENDDVGDTDGKDDIGRRNAFVFPTPKDPPESSIDLDAGRSSQARLGEDTVVHRFVGATTVSDEQKVENVCHHGLVEPTINLKEAMDDINSMFGKPIDFVRTTRRKRLEKAQHSHNQINGFTILPDTELDHQQGHSRPKSIARPESDLFEQTVCTKDALDEINKMFAMPLDF